jgi:DNA repair exonuclease SbcCD ATPase subunit
MAEDKQLLDVEQIDTVGFVPAGANPGAEILLFKARKDAMDDAQLDDLADRLAKALDIDKKEDQMSGEDTPTAEDLQKQLDDLQKAHDARAQELADTKAELEKAQAAAETEEDKVTKAADEADPVLKEHLDALRKQAEEDREEVQKLRAEREQERYATVAKGLPDIADVEDKTAFVADLYKGLGEDKAQSYLNHIRQAQALADQAGVFKEWGSDAPAAEEGQALATLEKMATERAAEDKVTYQQAFAKVLSENPKLYDQYRNEN